jgi:CRISPR-associated endonuclease/helicase Cas3
MSHCLKDLVDEFALAKKVDASARIQAANPLQATQCLADLEHQALHDILLKADFSPKAVQGWLHSAFYFTRFAQQQSPFRASEPETNFVLYVEDEELVIRFAPDRSLQGKPLGKLVAHVHPVALPENLKPRLWLHLDYASLIEEKRELLGRSLRSTFEYLGGFSLPDDEGSQKFEYETCLGFSRLEN